MCYSLYRNSPLRSTLNTGYIKVRTCVRVCTEAVDCVALGHWKQKNVKTLPRFSGVGKNMYEDVAWNGIDMSDTIWYNCNNRKPKMCKAHMSAAFRTLWQSDHPIISPTIIPHAYYMLIEINLQFPSTLTNSKDHSTKKWWKETNPFEVMYAKSRGIILMYLYHSIPKHWSHRYDIRKIWRLL